MATQAAWSHFLPSRWRCWTMDGYEGVSSNLHLGRYGPVAVDGYTRRCPWHSFRLKMRLFRLSGRSMTWDCSQIGAFRGISMWLVDTKVLPVVAAASSAIRCIRPLYT